MRVCAGKWWFVRELECCGSHNSGVVLGNVALVRRLSSMERMVPLSLPYSLVVDLCVWDRTSFACVRCEQCSPLGGMNPMEFFGGVNDFPAVAVGAGAGAMASFAASAGHGNRILAS